MNRCETLVCLVLAIAFLSTNLNAQESGIFSGRGIRSGADPQPKVEEESKTSWPKLKDFSFGQPPKLFQMNREADPAQKPLARLFMPRETNGEPVRESRFKLFDPPKFSNPFASENSILPGLNSILPQRDPSQPTFLEKFNMKSKELVDRTTDWAQRQNDQIRERTAETWGSITNFKPKQPTIPAKPPVRMAESPETQPRIRF